MVFGGFGAAVCLRVGMRCGFVPGLQKHLPSRGFSSVQTVPGHLLLLPLTGRASESTRVLQSVTSTIISQGTPLKILEPSVTQQHTGMKYLLPT